MHTFPMKRKYYQNLALFKFSFNNIFDCKNITEIVFLILIRFYLMQNGEYVYKIFNTQNMYITYII